MPTWPATLPTIPLLDDYGEKGAFPVIRSPNDGPQKSRRRYTAATVPVNCSVLLTAAQLAIFETFYETELYSGALRFTWKKRAAAGPACDYMFADGYGLSRVDQYWKVQMQLIRQP